MAPLGACGLGHMRSCNGDSDIDNILGVLKLFKKIEGLEKNVKIDSGFYKHSSGRGHYLSDSSDDDSYSRSNSHSDNGLDEKDDIIIIRGSKRHLIDIDAVIKAFRKMEEQFAKMAPLGAWNGVPGVHTFIVV